MPPQTGLEQWAELERQNLEAARIIVANPEKYPGLPLIASQLTLRKAEERATKEQARMRNVERDSV